MKRTLAFCLVCLFCVCYIYAQNKKYVESESYKYNMDYVDALTNRTDFYYISGNLEKAIQIEKEKLDILVYLLDNDSIHKVFYDKYNIEYCSTLKNLATTCEKMGEFPQMLYYCGMHTKSCRQYYGEKSKEYIEALSFQAFCYYEDGDYNKAVDIELKALSIQENENVVDSVAYARSLRNMAVYNGHLGNYSDAIKYAERSVVYLQNDKGNKLYGDAMSQLANCYIYVGNYDKAKNILNTLLVESRYNIKYDSSYFIYCLANCYYGAGEYNEAIRLYNEVLRYEEQNSDMANLKTASIYDNLAMSYASLEQFRDAIKSMEKSADITKAILGEDNIKYANSLINLGYIYRCVGEYDMAINYHEKALKIAEKEKDTNIFYVEALHYAFWNYIYKDANHALNLALEAYKLLKNFNSQITNTHFVCLRNLLIAYIGIGDYDKARKLLGTDFESSEMKQYLQENKRDYFKFLDMKSEFYHTLKDYKKAVNIDKQIISSIDFNNEQFDNSFVNLLKNYLALGDTSNIFRMLNQYDFVGKMYRRAYSNIISLTTKYTHSYWDIYSKIFADLLPVLANFSNNENAISMTYNYSALFAKGILLRENLKMSNAVKNSNNAILQNKYKQYQESLAFLNKSNVDNHKADSLYRVISDMEDEIKQMVLSKNVMDNSFVTWKDVQRCLKKHDVAIEYLSFPYGEDDHYYIALVLKDDYSCPHLHKLFAESELDSILSMTNYNPYQLYRIIWEALESELENIDNIYFSPSGRLYNIGIEYLPNKVGEPLYDNYNVYRLSSTQELLNLSNNNSFQKAVLYGGLDYDVEFSELQSEIQGINNEDQAILLRGGLRDSLSQRGGFEPLYNSGYEIKDIANILQENNISCKTYDGIHGTEESFKNLSEQRINILHIATHGMYIGEKEKENDTNHIFSFILPENKIESTPEDIALTRSFLVMSGGDMLPHRQVVPVGIEDGIITAEEISRLEFKDLNLVVLSACQSGLGDVSKEGVIGLQRGFKKAGANTILMSLDKVDDEATKILMVDFYRNLMNGKTKQQSLKDAQKHLRLVDNGKYDKPEYWASFIMLDGIN